MSVSQHPIALRLERRVGEGTQLLATVMGLPLVDGIFPALVLAGALSGPLGILEVGLLVFGGSATLAVVLAEMEGTRRERVVAILTVGAVLLPVAAAEAALAPTIQHLIDLTIFRRFAALVILAIAAKTASATIGEYLPSPGVIVGLGLVGSANPAALAEPSLQLVADPMLVARGVAAAGVGIAFALGVALLAPWLHGGVDLDRFRFGSAVALGVLALSIIAPYVIPANAPVALAVLAVTSLLAFDPASADSAAADGPSEEPVDGDEGDAIPWVPDAGAGDGDVVAVGDGGERTDTDGDDREDDDARGSPGVSDGDRAPWL